MQVLEVSSMAQANELAVELGLPLVLDGPAGAPPPLPPFDAPFSRLVPELLRLARTYGPPGLPLFPPSPLFASSALLLIPGPYGS